MAENVAKQAVYKSEPSTEHNPDSIPVAAVITHTQGRTGRVILDLRTFQDKDEKIKELAEAEKDQSGQFTTVYESNSYWAADREDSKHCIVSQNTQYLIQFIH